MGRAGHWADAALSAVKPVAIARLAGTARRAGISLGVLVALSGCQVVPQNGSSPAPTPTPAQAPAPAPIVPPASSQSSLGWEVAPVEQGGWTYRVEGADRLAMFGPAGVQPLFAIACLASSKQVVIRLPAVGVASRAITLRTTYGVLQWPAVSTSGGLSVTRAPSDSGLDWLAYSRGRFAVELDGQPHLIVPSGSEVGRVIEDCRS